MKGTIVSVVMATVWIILSVLVLITTSRVVLATWVITTLISVFVLPFLMLIDLLD